jgi:flagellar basal-body rod protein FlgB
MLNRISEELDFQAKALDLRAERQKVIASNIANADTPGYKAVDFDFAAVMQQAAAGASGGGLALARTSGAHLDNGAAAGTVSEADLKYRQPAQAAIDNNTVDLDMERAAFTENAVKYEATLRFITNQIKTLQAALQSPVNS